ncbi:DNA primase/helicase [Acidovorax phage ACP17]|uniref:DNA primase/helicase n=1 Tax=Acidovorax phage ACP17 TaxID=2010329 RepID=A0A218M2Y5_9CAUD|nr:DNA primase/helicase [Acidovorax phage ACP17]ASD50407.1 DNA primase/helicase [Acidovorax phage ACP17]
MSEITNERLILSSLVQNEDFGRRVSAYLKRDYFASAEEATVLGYVQDFVQKYAALPNKADLKVIATNDAEISEATTEVVHEVIEDIFDIEPSRNTEFLVKTADEFCKSRAMFNAIQEAIEIYKGESKKTVHAIADIMRDAMAVSFDPNVGHEYLADAEARWDYYENPASKIPFDLKAFNENTNGGVERKTLNLLIAGINVGKTMSLVSLAAMYMRMGYNVLYCSNEMAEQKIMNRVDANMLGTSMNEIRELGKEAFMGRIEKMRQKTYGRLFCKAWPTGTATANHFRHAVNEIRIKKRVQIDILIVDYLQITTTGNIKLADNSYQKYKAVAEEIRALCVEEDMVGWTAAQFNRGGLDNSDPGMGEVGESTGIPATVDGMWALIRTEELDEVGQLLVSELKSRYGDKSKPKFAVGVNINTQKLFDVNDEDRGKFITERKPKANAKPKEAPPKATVQSTNKTIGKFKNLKVTDD